MERVVSGAWWWLRGRGLKWAEEEGGGRGKKGKGKGKGMVEWFGFILPKQRFNFIYPILSYLRCLPSTGNACFGFSALTDR